MSEASEALDRMAADYPEEFERFFAKAREVVPLWETPYSDGFLVNCPYWWPDERIEEAFVKIYGEYGWMFPWEETPVSGAR